MIDAESQSQLRQAIVARMLADRGLLDTLRDEIRPLRNSVRRILPRTATAISLVGADGGDNSLRFDPFLVQLVRVVDSSNNHYCLEAVTPTTSVAGLSAQQFTADGAPRTVMGEMMAYLGVQRLAELSPMIRANDGSSPVNRRWVQVYRELMEWAVLFHIVRAKDFATDTLIVCDGLLRSVVFSGDLFGKYLHGLQEGIERAGRMHRHIYVAGVAKHNRVLERYRLAMALEHVFATTYPAYAEIPRHLEEKAHAWMDHARDGDQTGDEFPGRVGGKMFFVKFGSGTRDPIWPVDIFLPQAEQAQMILGYLLADAVGGFPVPFYPQCLQKAHENAALIDFDLDMLQDDVFEGIRQALGAESHALDIFRLQDADPARVRYTT